MGADWTRGASVVRVSVTWNQFNGTWQVRRGGEQVGTVFKYLGHWYANSARSQRYYTKADAVAAVLEAVR